VKLLVSVVDDVIGCLDVDAKAIRGFLNRVLAIGEPQSKASPEASNWRLTRRARNGHRLALKAQAHCEERNLLPEF